MLQLSNITKDYAVAGEVVSALKGVSLNFRSSEFVSILGPSGCGKTTLLNIIGGLDKYTSGDLIIEGKSTKQYSDRDWDTYRNHSIGFIFQSYHLIPHQTILQNVELALTIAGVDKEERRRRAIDALEKVGLSDKIKNRPNQLSGGQAQRVAIARALINDPEIVLADEPTGALDSVTSVQIMDLLKEISKDRLVIMVTHNPELAEQYSTRIVKLKDGEIIGDTMPYDGAPEEPKKKLEPVNAATEEANEATEEIQPAHTTNKGKKKQSSMSIGMAMGLSFKNLLSKRKRTAMVGIAGSIGIIGVSMVLAISAGVKGYISGMEDDMISGYPLEVTESAIDMGSLMNMTDTKKVDITRLNDKVYVDSVLETLMSFNNAFSTNVITKEYKKYVDAIPQEYYQALMYGYGVDMANYIYTDYNYTNAAGEDVTTNLSISGIRSVYTSVLNEQPQYKGYSSLINTIESFKQVPDNYKYILSQYDILATSSGKTSNLSEAELKDIFENKNSLIMVVKDDNLFSDLNFGQFGYMTQEEFLCFAFKAMGDESKEVQSTIDKYNGKWDDVKNEYEEGLNGTDFSFFIGENAKTFRWYPNSTVFTKVRDEDYAGMTLIGRKRISAYEYSASSEGFSEDSAVDMSVKVILRKKSNVSYGCLGSGLYYTQALTDHLLQTSANSDIAQYLKAAELAPEVIKFNYAYSYPDKDNRDIIHDDTTEGYITGSSGINLMAVFTMSAPSTGTTITLNTVGGTDIPKTFSIYPMDFTAKNKICDYLDKWNEVCDKPLNIRVPAGKAITVTGNKKIEGEYNLPNDITATLEDGTTVKNGVITMTDGTIIDGIHVTLPGGVQFSLGDETLPEGVVRQGNLVTLPNGAKIDGGTITLNDGTVIQVPVIVYSDGTILFGLHEGDKIKYTDTVGLIINLINTMIQMITIALIAFTALSLIVSTVMIGIITYVSVVERIKEIGILRAVGARKKDIKRLFNAETFIIGFIAGIIGIFVTYMLSLVVNIIVYSLAGIWGIAALPWWQAIIMVILSIGLTLISGLIPASAAAKKDPVVALRTE